MLEENRDTGGESLQATVHGKHGDLIYHAQIMIVRELRDLGLSQLESWNCCRVSKMVASLLST